MYSYYKSSCGKIHLYNKGGYVNTDKQQGKPQSKTQSKQSYNCSSSIAAMQIISESELVKVLEDYSSDWEVKYPVAMQEILFSLGLDTSLNYERQDAIQHRNRFNEVVVCSRWVGVERSDKLWVESGYASKEALDRSKNSRLLDDSYRSRGLTVDAQKMLEARDERESKDKSVEETK